MVENFASPVGTRSSVRSCARVVTTLVVTAVGWLVIPACGNFQLPNFPYGPASATTTGAQGASNPPSAIPVASPEILVKQLTSTGEDDEMAPVASPDGSFVLFSSLAGTQRKEKKQATQLMSVDARNGGAATAFSRDDVNGLDPVFLPDSSGYLFISDTMGKWAVVRTQTLSPGSAVTLVTGPGVVDPRHPSVSPDSQQLAFSMKKGAETVIASTSIAGTGLTVLGPGQTPIYSPDGTHLAFVRTAKGVPHVFSMATNGRAVTQVTSGEYTDSSPAYSPDGTRIAFLSTRGAKAPKVTNVFLIGVDGTGLKQLTQGDDELRDLSWARDGSIYFAGDSGRKGQFDVFRLEFTDGSQTPPSPPPPVQAPPPTFAPPPSVPTGTPTQAPVCAESCAGGQACPNLACACRDGRIVNTQDCRNGCCVTPELACVSSCRGHNGYTGHLAGDAPAAPPPPDAPPAASPSLPVGKTCSRDSECASNVCVFSGNASRGYCSTECQSFTDCPTFWRCEHVRNGSNRYCVQR